MSIYRLSLSAIARRTGRSAVAAAAYRAAERLRDPRTGLVHDYRRKDGVLHRALVGWSGSREALWAAAEAREVRTDAKTAREVQLALPAELPDAARWELALAMAGWLRARYGVAVDCCAHAPRRRSDPRGFHAHLLCTTRRVEGDSLGQKTRELDDRGTGPVEVETMRAVWAELVNTALAAAGRPERVDHRSYQRQGVAREAEHLSRGARELEARGVATDRGDEHRARRRRNRLRRAAPAAPLSPRGGFTAPEPRRRR